MPPDLVKATTNLVTLAKSSLELKYLEAPNSEELGYPKCGHPLCTHKTDF